MIETLTTLNIGSVSLGLVVVFAVLIAIGNWGKRKQREMQEREERAKSGAQS